MSCLVETLSSDDEDHIIGRGNDEDDEEDEAMNEEFEFGGMLGEDGGFTDLRGKSSGKGMRSALEVLTEHSTANATMKEKMKTKIENIIAAERKNLKKKNEEDDADKSEEETDDNSENNSSEEDESSREDEESDDLSSEDDKVDDENMAGNMASDRLVPRSEAAMQDMDEDNDASEKTAKKRKQQLDAFFETTKTATVEESNNMVTFHQFNLSRPVLKAIESELGYATPTLVQSSCIPIIQSGRDVCASAQTGSGKTCAFLIPIVESLIQTTGLRQGARALVMTPTRELACQIYTTLTKLAKHSPSLTATLVTGGSKNTAGQAQELRKSPHIIIATPGRLCDHLVNTAGFDLMAVEYLVLDEADRLLELGFEDELVEIIKGCNTERRTLLFSATMGTSSLEQLTTLALKRPVRVNCISKDLPDPDENVASITIPKRITQEFIRLQSESPIRRDAIVLALLTRTFKKGVLVFIETKVLAHKMRVLLGLCGIVVGELHGNLSQTERMENLALFESGKINVLICTDLAARGLDFLVNTVINYEIPSNLATYVHRIGRTGRAGRKGTSCSLVSEGRRQQMKKIISLSPKSPAVTRTVPPEVINHFVKKIESLGESIKAVLQAEYVANLDAKAEMEAQRVQNLIEHSDDIKARPKKEWIKTNKNKLQALSSDEPEKTKEPGLHRMSRKKKRRMEALAVFNAANNEDGPAPVVKKKLKQTLPDPFAEEKPKKKKKKSHNETSEFSSDLGENSFSSKMKGEVIGGTYHFRGYDPDFKLGKKKGSKKFKSKSKYKRR